MSLPTPPRSSLVNRGNQAPSSSTGPIHSHRLVPIRLGHALGSAHPKGSPLPPPPSLPNPLPSPSQTLSLLRPGRLLPPHHLVSVFVPVHSDDDDTSISTHLSVFVKCNDQKGAEFIHAEPDMSIADVTAPVDVPEIVSRSSHTAEL